MFSRVLVANRGEVAVRVIRALHELGCEAVAVYSTADEDATFVRMADRALRIGPPPAAQSYLRIPSLIAAATTTGCEAVHPGWGFLAENPAFVRACDENDLVFIGPPPDVMARMGDKAQAKRELRAAGVPLVPGTSGTPASRSSCFACALSPIRSMTAGDGPTNTRSFSSQARANAGFSARNPQPGCTASQPVVVAAAMSDGMRR